MALIDGQWVAFPRWSGLLYPNCSRACDNDEVLEKLQEVKLSNKERFARFVKEEIKLDIDPTALFDVQKIGRAHV